MSFFNNFCIRLFSIRVIRRISRDIFEKQIKTTLEANFCPCTTEDEANVEIDMKNVIALKVRNIPGRNFQLNEIPKKLTVNREEYHLIFLIGVHDDDVTCVLYKEQENSFLKADAIIEIVSENTEINVKFIAYAHVI